MDTAAVPARAEAEAIVHDATRRYFAERHRRVRGFVDRHFSMRGTLALHRRALGWDIARAPLNLSLALPQAGMLAASATARRIGAKRLKQHLGARRLLVPTADAGQINWLLPTE